MLWSERRLDQAPRSCMFMDDTHAHVTHRPHEICSIATSYELTQLIMVNEKINPLVLKKLVIYMALDFVLVATCRISSVCLRRTSV